MQIQKVLRNALLTNYSTSIHKHVFLTFQVSHRQVLRRPIVASVYDQRSEASLGHLLRTHAGTTTTSNNDHIRVNQLWLIARRKLEKLESIALTLSVVDRCAGKSKDRTKSWTCLCPC